MNKKQAGSKFQGVSPVEKSWAKEDRNEENGEYIQLLVEFRRS